MITPAIIRMYPNDIVSLLPTLSPTKPPIVAAKGLTYWAKTVRIAATTAVTPITLLAYGVK